MIKFQHYSFPDRRALASWNNSSNLFLLGSTAVSRLPIFSFVIRHPVSGLFLHHNYVCALLNDMFGIQARGGCACAGPYAQVLDVYVLKVKFMYFQFRKFPRHYKLWLGNENRKLEGYFSEDLPMSYPELQRLFFRLGQSKNESRQELS